MSGASSIEWCDATWNPVRGCSMAPGSEAGGCLNCYAARMAARNLPGMRSPTTGKNFARMLGAGPRWTGEVEPIPSLLDWPMRKKNPLRIFVNSMSDLFHEKLSNEAIAAVFGVMALCHQHTFQILTKRPERMREWVEEYSAYSCIEDLRLGRAGVECLSEPLSRALEVWGETSIGPFKGWPLSNVWLGTSVENQATADERIPHLLATPAAKRFVSYEPALGPVNFHRIEAPDGKHASALQGHHDDNYYEFDTALDWIIVGGESGPGARPFDIAWARSTVAQCKAAGVAVFVKQLGSRPMGLGTDLRPSRVSDRPELQSDTFPLRLKHQKGGDPSEWPGDLRVQEFPR